MSQYSINPPWFYHSHGKTQWQIQKIQKGVAGHLTTLFQIRFIFLRRNSVKIIQNFKEKGWLQAPRTIPKSANMRLDKIIEMLNRNRNPQCIKIAMYSFSVLTVTHSGEAIISSVITGRVLFLSPSLPSSRSNFLSINGVSVLSIRLRSCLTKSYLAGSSGYFVQVSLIRPPDLLDPNLLYL